MRLVDTQSELIRFPRTFRESTYTKVVLLTSPILFSDTELWQGDNTRLIPWLNARGYTVFLLRLNSAYSSITMLSAALPKAIEEVKKISGNRKIVVGGVSVGGQALLSFLLSQAPEINMVDRVFFLGTGFDYQYPGSFMQKIQSGNLWPHNCPATLFAKNCEGIYLTSYEERGPHLKARSFSESPFAYAPPNKNDLGRINKKALFLGGKIDPVAPSESLFKTFRNYGSLLKKSKKRYFVAGEDNFLRDDYDHAMLFASKNAGSEIFHEIQKYIEKD